MLIRRPDDILPSEITDPAVYHARRRFMAQAGTLGSGVNPADHIERRRPRPDRRQPPSTSGAAHIAPSRHHL